MKKEVKTIWRSPAQANKHQQDMDLVFQVVRYEHYARLYIERDGKYLVSWGIPGTKSNCGHKTFKNAAEAIGTYTLYENLINKYYEQST